MNVASETSGRRTYHRDAYQFIFAALHYTQQTRGGEDAGRDEGETPAKASLADSGGRRVPVSGHLTGPQLLKGLREYALEEYGPLARTVFAEWNVRTTRDFGEIVFDLVRQGEMRATPDDRVEDFDDVFDFEADLVEKYRVETSRAFS